MPVSQGKRETGGDDANRVRVQSRKSRYTRQITRGIPDRLERGLSSQNITRSSSPILAPFPLARRAVISSCLLRSCLEASVAVYGGGGTDGWTVRQTSISRERRRRKIRPKRGALFLHRNLGRLLRSGGKGPISFFISPAAGFGLKLLVAGQG